MKKFINNPEDVVEEMLEGMAAAHSDELRRLPGWNVLVRKDAPLPGKVGLVSGGGSGHEPAHAGYIGENMLDAAVAGEVFTSPAPDQIFEAIKAVDSGSGVLLIVKNFSGDVMNFDMAAEMAAAEGIETAQVVVKDDIAVERKEDRRGTAGTVLVHKIVGTALEEGLNLQEAVELAHHVTSRLGSMGISLSPSTVPASGKPGFTLADDEMELGTGIHGEPGMERKKIQPADAVAEELLDNVTAELDVKNGDDVIVLVNGQGSTPLMELYIVYRKAAQLLFERNISIHKSMVGEYMSSLEMAGCSLTLLKLDDTLKKYVT
ncbi:dihydroxyacetone kinase subunit DhaK [Salibacterium qingdaonense]|uniref:Dihydroxyacetone kinase, N-terminal domain n=1 Tax=Salibacterium qingdaonense TaxID=266892 RepID=A0A1I4LBD5_9BACI|nr:dihydroxyacetone kinase subunit DhaK [Salibacterium qingdaonense]SFL88324.1 dihydroxyacetone kinase, N-terminal domain [Salibacterium qingdaonense]